jgi:hypothetical protein
VATARGKSKAVEARAPRAKAAKAAETEVVVHGIKGFDKDLKCLGYQYEIGGAYEHKGSVTLCRSGFHSIDGNPLDVLDFYPLIGDDGKLNRFASVVASGEIKRDGSSKICSAKLAVSVELKIPDLITSAVKFVIDACKTTKGGAVQAASGDYSQLAASGDYSQLAASGDSSKLAASGDYSKLAASGYSSQLAASGDYSKLAASGNYSKLAASGYSSQLAASGDYSKLAASGDSSKLAASGYSSQLAASGKNSVIVASSPGCAAEGAEGTWISLAEFDRNGKCIGFATGCIGRDGLEAGTPYTAKNGKLVEVSR